MSRSSEDLPERLLDKGATDLERRLLAAALDRKPSAATSRRMAQALGLGVSSLAASTAVAVSAAEGASAGVATGGAAASASATVSTSTAGGATAGVAAAGTSLIWPWVSAGVVAMAIAGSVIGLRAWRMTPATPPTPARTAAPPAEAAPPAPVPAVRNVPAAASTVEIAPEAPAAAPGSLRRARGAAVARDVRDEVAVLDAARAAVVDGNGRRALEILRRYQDRYPAGNFRPEATAIRIEALMTLGREAEARTLAERFVAEHRGSLLAKRVSGLVGLQAP